MNRSKLKPLAASSWGGNGIRLDIEANGAKIEYACAAGEITGKLYVDEEGHFSVAGFHIKNRPGPSREDQPPVREPVIYKGTVRGDSMTIKVILKSDGSAIGEFTLTKGKNVRLIHCL